MSEETFLGMLVVALGTLSGLYFKFKSNADKQRQPIINLTEEIIKLNLNIKHMLENDLKRDKNIEDLGILIKEITDKQRENERILQRHDFRLENLEERVKKG